MKARGLPQTGNKSDLVTRLQNAIMNPSMMGISGDATLDAMLADAIGHDRTNDSTSQDSGSNYSSSQIMTSAPSVKPPSPKPLPTSPVRVSPTKTQPLSVSTANNQVQAEPKTTTAAAASPTKTSVKLTAPSAPVVESKPEEKSPLSSPTATRKASEIKTLSAEERLALRASKFGAQDKLLARAARFGTQGSKEADKNLPKSIKVLGGSEAKVETDPEVLKKRAERFGTVVSDKLKKMDIDERLNKRKERFGAGDSAASNQAGTKRTPVASSEEEVIRR